MFSAADHEFVRQVLDDLRTRLVERLASDIDASASEAEVTDVDGALATIRERWRRLSRAHRLALLTALNKRSTSLEAGDPLLQQIRAIDDENSAALEQLRFGFSGSDTTSASDYADRLSWCAVTLTLDGAQ